MIFGIAALLISIMLGIVYDVSGFYIFLRAIIFTPIFFGLGVGIHVLITGFFPDLLNFQDEEPSPQESFDQEVRHVNITLGSAGDYAVPEMYRNDPDAGELGNIEDLIAGNFKPRLEPAAQVFKEGIDRREEEDYNMEETGFSAPVSEPIQESPVMQFQPSPPPPPKDETMLFQKPVFTPTLGDDSDDITALPDLGSMAGAFSSKDGAEPFAFGGASGFEPAPLIEDAESVLPAPALGGEEQEYNKGNKPQPLEGDFTAQELAKGISSILAQDK
jgi:hypothetical protein